ncbi:GAF domain-containing protein [uncultured Friedmanniella sp.]|uniref:GAF domain-containing protein n=1 Tax=uncultured Friedmanniella sp. TaxID=335381 RepID=UPI0035C94F61
MSASRPYYDSADPPDPMLDVVYDSVQAMLERDPSFSNGLAEVAGLVQRNIRGADAAGVALSNGGTVTFRVASSRLAEQADDVQYGLGEGPCLTAVAERRGLKSGSLREHETWWPRFAHDVRQLGIESVLSLPLMVRADVIGSINIYSRRADAFVDEDVTNGIRFAWPVAAAIRSAQVLRNLDELTDQMQDTLEVHALVSAAVGFLRHRESLSAEDARLRLSNLAAARHQTVAEAATQVLEDRNDDRYDGTP